MTVCIINKWNGFVAIARWMWEQCCQVDAWKGIWESTTIPGRWHLYGEKAKIQISIWNEQLFSFSFKNSKMPRISREIVLKVDKEKSLKIKLVGVDFFILGKLWSQFKMTVWQITKQSKAKTLS